MLRDGEDLRQTLRRIDRRGYKAYKDIQGSYQLPGWILHIDHVQGDPFASPSRLRVCVPQLMAKIPDKYYANRSRRIAMEDYLTRQFARAIRSVAEGHRGTGKSGIISIDCGRQEILERTSANLSEHEVEVLFVAGLPAAGRSVLAREAEEMLLHEIPEIVSRSLLLENLDANHAWCQVCVAEDQDALRDQVRAKELIAFVGNDSVLPRRSGVDDRPLTEVGDPQDWSNSREQSVVRFTSPESLAVTCQTPHVGAVRGMGIPRGVTLIVGGGFHGKSTLLEALEKGVYNHIPGDGREHVVSDPTAVKIRAEDGRRIEKVDISPFISDLPLGRDTKAFCTDNASGSTSQAAAIMEALELGAQTLLIDEDTSASNFMIRDVRMQSLVAKSREPITPFVDKARLLWEEMGVSTVLVMGGSGDYFEAADVVVQMDAYRPVDVTKRAKAVAEEHRTGRRAEGGSSFGAVTKRYPEARSFSAGRGRKEVRIDAKGLSTLLYGETAIDLSLVEQLVDVSQTRAIGQAILLLSRVVDNKRLSLKQALEEVAGVMDEKGLKGLNPTPVGNLARPRLLEIGAAINRMRSLIANQ